MDIRSIRYFIEVANECNITRAAENLHMAQPPLSRQMQMLEEELGVTLFQRSRKRLSLTEEGELLKIRGEQILSLVDKTVDEVRNLHAGVSGTLYIGTVEGLGPSLLARWIADFVKRYPKVHFQLWNGTTDDVTDRMSKGLLDLAVIMEPFDHETLNFVTAARTPWIAMFPNEHPIACRESDTIDLSELVDFPIIMPSRKSRVAEIRSWFENIDAEPDIICEVGNYLNARELTAKGVGIAIFPRTAENSRSNSWVTEKRIVNPERIASYAMVWRKDRVLSPLSQRFIRFVEEHEVEHLT